MLKKWILKMTIALLKGIISKVNYPPLKNYLLTQLNQLEDLITIFTDGNPNNNQQLAKYWQDNKTEIIKEHLETTLELVNTEFSDKEWAKIIIEALGSVDFDENDMPPLQPN